jgi:hypothetical protein
LSRGSTLSRRKTTHVLVISRWSKDKTCRWVGELSASRTVDHTVSSGRQSSHGNKWQLAATLGMPVESEDFAGILEEMDRLADTDR